jgi:hypothetical protein
MAGLARTRRSASVQRVTDEEIRYMADTWAEDRKVGGSSP